MTKPMPGKLARNHDSVCSRPIAVGAIDPDDDDDLPIEREMGPVMGALIERRAVLQGLATGAAWTAGTSIGLGGGGAALAAGKNPSSLTFKQTDHVIGDDHAVAEGYNADVIIKWGDALFRGTPNLDPKKQTAALQAKQFGYNNDFIAYLPLPVGSNNSDHGLLCINHEYTNPELMWPDVTKKTRTKISKDRMDVEMAAHGHSIIEVKKTGTDWTVIKGSKFTRRITAMGTEMRLSGPAAGTARMKTSADDSGAKVIGTINNCAGGKTPWGTVLIAEENIHAYFSGDPQAGPESGNHKRMGIRGKPSVGWGEHVDRFNVMKEPNEPNRFGWLVEIDPYDPKSTPVKRTALGRFKHEGAGVTQTPDGRAVVYSGDDQRFEYLYKFVSAARINKQDRYANSNLLDRGTLYVARFDDDGGAWLPLIYGTGPLIPQHGFNNQADVMIETRRASDLLGATPMDRPEDVGHNQVNDKVYVMLTNNTKRTTAQVDAANPRANNKYGHIIEIEAPKGAGGKADHGALTFKWNIVLVAGDPSEKSHGAKYHRDTSTHGAWLAAPDNCAFDPQGRLWISTDQGSNQKKNNIPDGMYACDLDNNMAGRALTRFFFACPQDAEMCGPEFTPDGKTLFVAVQHPAEGSTLAKPSTRWPDFKDDMPPRASVVAITKKDGGLIGS